MKDSFSILNVSGPYREPREPVFSYDYAIQRSNWPTANSVRIKVSIPDELDYLKNKILSVSGGSPGQQLRVTQLLCRRIADRKLQIADEQSMLLERRDVMIDPFTGPLVHLFTPLEAWMSEQKTSLREEVREQVGL